MDVGGYRRTALFTKDPPSFLRDSTSLETNGRSSWVCMADDGGGVVARGGMEIAFQFVTVAEGSQGLNVPFAAITVSVWMGRLSDA